MLVLLVTQLCAGLYLNKQVVPAGPPVAMQSGPMNPVSKVVKLLQDMSVTLSNEQKGDEEVYEKYSCWCTTTIKEKEAALGAAATKREELEASILEFTAQVAKLDTEIKQLKEEREANKKAIATATEIRSTEHQEFLDSTAEIRATIASLTEALAALQKGTGLTALLQLQTTLRSQHKDLPAAVAAWLQTANKQADAQPADFKSYNARSGQIVGILAQMKDDFSADMKQEQEAEDVAQASFEKLVAAKQAEIKAQTESILEKTQQKTDAEISLVNAKKDLKDLEKQVGEDMKVLADAKERCPKMDEEFAARKQQRQEEIVAINEALQILTDDSARDTFSSTFSFAQVRLAEKKQEQARARAVAILTKASKSSAVMQTGRAAMLVQAAASVKLDAFTKVLAYIDDMVKQLSEEQKAEVEHQRWCTAELRKNAQETTDQTWQAEDYTKKVNDLAEQLETLDDDLANLQAAIAENLKVIKRAGEDREAANAEFKQSVADQRGAVMILTKVLERLQKVYAPDVLKAKQQKRAVEAENAANAERAAMTPGAANAGIKVANDQKLVPEVPSTVLVQQPGGFDKPYKKQASGGVLGLIEETIGDAERLVDEAVHAEQEDQTAYETLVTDTGNSVAADRKSVADKTGERAAAALAKDEAEKSLEATNTELADLAHYKGSLHKACDFVLNNFDLRQEARANEIDALKNAHAILSGADFS